MIKAQALSRTHKVLCDFMQASFQDVWLAGRFKLQPLHVCLKAVFGFISRCL